MFVVPVTNDKIKNLDGDEFVVSSYTNLKKEPAVYTTEKTVIFFTEIDEINGVRVSYNTGSKCFESLGVMRRRYNLPQPGDECEIVVKAAGTESQNILKVKHLKLHNRSEGIANGLVVCDDALCVKLTEITNIKRKQGSEKFDPAGFKKYYFDYLPFKA
jgi:hypothetical protein